MGIPVLVVGESGSGKTTSLRNFKKEEIGVFSVAGKPLPFRNKLDVINNADYVKIYSALQKGGRKSYAIDDSQYLMCFELFDRAKEKGYDKFSEIGCAFQTLVRYITTSTAPDTIVYFLHHAETTDTGKVKAKTIGKMLDNHLTLEGLFSIVLFCDIDDGKHIFRTQSDGYNTAKSPIDMLENPIDNDLAEVDKKIREYYFTEESNEIN